MEGSPGVSNRLVQPDIVELLLEVVGRSQLGDLTQPLREQEPLLIREMARAGVVSPSTVTRGRSAGLVPKPSMQIIPGMTSCRTSTYWRCFDVFTTSGYEIVSGTVDGKAMRDSILVTVVVPSGLALTCTPADSSHPGSAKLVRADSVTCKASVTPAGATDELVITDWTFASSDSSFALSRRGAGLFGPDSTQWSGTMVISGKVTVTGTVGGVAATDSAAITVKARDWSKDTVAYEIKRVPTSVKDPPDSVEDLGSNDEIPATIISTFRSITTGPNTGMSYFAAIPFKLTFEVSLDTNAMRVGSQFSSMQPFAATRVDGIPYCARFHVTADTIGVKAHEGFRATDINSHTDSYKAAFLNLVRVPAERLVGPGATPDPTSIRQSAHALAQAQSILITHAPATNPYFSNCVFNYDPKKRIP